MGGVLKTLRNAGNVVEMIQIGIVRGDFKDCVKRWGDWGESPPTPQNHVLSVLRGFDFNIPTALKGWVGHAP